VSSRAVERRTLADLGHDTVWVASTRGKTRYHVTDACKWVTEDMTTKHGSVYPIGHLEPCGYCAVDEK